MTDLTGLIKAYDVRGIVGEQLTEEIARAIGAAFADTIVTPEGETSVVIGHDMRDSGPGLVNAVTSGLRDRGVDVVSIGLCSTDGLYHATGALDMPGVMVTASHNPAAYNGMKLCRSRARAVGENTGLGLVRELATRYVDEGVPSVEAPGSASDREMLREYGEFLRSLVPLDAIRPLKVVVDAGNAMAGHTVPAVLGEAAGLPGLPLEIVPLYFELDGTFPNHEPNPLEEKNLVDLQAAVVEHGADLGLAFDGDADRCFVVDEKGAIVRASAITALVGLREAARVRASGGDATVIYNVISSKAVPELLTADGIATVRSRVGHSFIKAQMAEHDAVFGGEHSAHFYFRDFFYADSGMLAALHVMAALGAQDGPLSAMLADYDPYTASGEINSTVADVAAALDRIREAFGSRDAVTLDEMDGLTVQHWDAEPRWWFNVRPSGTEPLLRLNVEAADAATMEDVRDQALAIIRES
ncbi:phosphomannomutase/phosphoglucomutase [Demequina zhanjiangensis]|uniref:Phosphomannomutase/phosphoglucomutase n=1 Tax=Demequina zhanjiangensis TaxID=3051659 RepID=A0ABT8FXY5_9MICO|nr:phosphomannomutase/phosphoglucomutase [Demequina sp. SYSU T00b26]MDN4471677.1 phosphomannomutase/phosphoglucomutase [Demequina sp. SYSU T00b26]